MSLFIWQWPCCATKSEPPDTACFSCQRKWCSWSEGWWEANIPGHIYSRPDSKELCDLGTAVLLFQESKTTGQCGLVCLHLSGVCSIAPVTLSHRAVVTALWGATVQGGGRVRQLCGWSGLIPIQISVVPCWLLTVDMLLEFLQSLDSLSLKWEQ